MNVTIKRKGRMDGRKERKDGWTGQKDRPKEDKRRYKRKGKM